MSNCKARQYSDQMLCACGLAWDVNDPEPPECPAYGVQDVREKAPPTPEVKPAQVDRKRQLDRLRAELGGVVIPDVLDAVVRIMREEKGQQ